MNSGSISEPDYSMALARVKRMTREELDELLNGDGSKMEEYINSLEQVNLSKSFVIIGTDDSSCNFLFPSMRNIPKPRFRTKVQNFGTS